jgi:hypothetical protein
MKNTQVIPGEPLLEAAVFSWGYEGGFANFYQGLSQK